MKSLITLLLIASLIGCTKDHTQPSQLAITAKITSIVIDRNVYLSGEDSYSPGSRIVSYTWTIGQLRATGEKAIIMANPGVHLVKLEVADEKGGKADSYYSIVIK